MSRTKRERFWNFIEGMGSIFAIFPGGERTPPIVATRPRLDEFDVEAHRTELVKLLGEAGAFQLLDSQGSDLKGQIEAARETGILLQNHIRDMIQDCNTYRVARR